MTTPPFDNPLVREAIAHAVPYDTIVDNVFANATRAYSIVNPASPSFIPAWDQYDTDLDRARELLTQAGLGDGFETEIYYYDTSRQEQEEVALFLQASLGEVGIDLALRPLPATEFASQTTARFDEMTPSCPAYRFAAPSSGWTTPIRTSVCGSLPRGFPGPVGVGGFSNASHYSNIAVDTLHFEHRFNPDLDTRAEAYRGAQRLAAGGHPDDPGRDPWSSRAAVHTRRSPV